MNAPHDPQRSTPSDADAAEARLVSSVVDVLAGLTATNTKTAPKARPSRAVGGHRSPGDAGKVIKSSHLAYAMLEGERLVLVDSEKKRPVRNVRSLLRKVVAPAVIRVVRGAEDIGHFDPHVLQIARVVERALPEARRRVSETTIEKILGALIETQDPIAKVSAEIDAANANARMRFISTFPTLTAEEVADRTGSKARNRHQAASRLKGEGKVFAVSWNGLERFPAFQFDHDRPVPAVAATLAALPDRMSSWETAFWFVSTNGWLDGRAPIDELRGDPGRVLEAARREGEAVAG